MGRIILIHLRFTITREPASLTLGYLKLFKIYAKEKKKTSNNNNNNNKTYKTSCFLISKGFSTKPKLVFTHKQFKALEFENDFSVTY